MISSLMYYVSLLAAQDLEEEHLVEDLEDLCISRSNAFTDDD